MNFTNNSVYRYSVVRDKRMQNSVWKDCARFFAMKEAFNETNA